jgi:hypothetical protein
MQGTYLKVGRAHMAAEVPIVPVFVDPVRRYTCVTCKGRQLRIRYASVVSLTLSCVTPGD